MDKQTKLFLSRAAMIMLESPQMTFEQAMRATLDRDKEIAAMFDKSTEQGREMRAALAEDIWRRANGKSA